MHDVQGRRRSLSTGDLSATAEMSVESSADDSVGFSGDMLAADGYSDLEADVLSNLEEENNDDDSQASADLEEAAAFNNERKMRMNRFEKE